jgi:hypothetical protein
VVPASGERMIGPIQDAFKDGNGQAQITYDAVTSVTVAAFNLAAL